MSRYLDPVGIGVCDTQELHLHPSAADGGVDTEGCPSTEGLGLGYWEEKAQVGERYQEMSYICEHGAASYVQICKVTRCRRETLQYILFLTF